MAIQTLGLTSNRQVTFLAETIKATFVSEILCKVGRQVQMPKNNTNVYTARTWVPYNASAATKAGRNQRFPQDVSQVGVDRGANLVAAHRSVDGVSSASDTLVPLDYQTTIQAFECSFSFTRQISDFHTDPIPQIMKDQIPDRVSSVNEMVVYSALKACVNVFYGGTGSSVGTVNGALTLQLLRKIAASLMRNSAKQMSKIIGASANISTMPVAPAFFVYLHTDLVSDLRVLATNVGTYASFVPVENYANGQALPYEVGKIEGFRFFASPFWPQTYGAGAAIGATGCVSTFGTNIDVFPVIVMGQDAFSQISLRGMDVMDMTFIPCETKTKSDIHGKRGYAGAYWYKGTVIENDGWMALAYVGNLVI